MESDLELGPWVAAWRGPLIGLIASGGVPWRDAVELAQDTLAEAWVGRGRFLGDLGDATKAGPWLRGIARNLVAAWWRSLRSDVDVHELDPEAPAGEEDVRLARLRAELLRLPEKEREVLCMHYLEESDVRTVAALLEVTEKTVEGRLYRGRKLLHERMTLEQAR